MAEQTPAERVQAISTKIIEWENERDELQEAIDNSKLTIASILGDGTHLEGDFKVEIYTGKQFNEAYARKNLTPEQIKRASAEVTVFSAKTAQDREFDAEGNIIKGLTEDEYALAQKPHDKKTVKIEVRKD